MARMSLSSQRPRELLTAFKAGSVPDDDLPELIAFAWTRDDQPTSDVSEADWIEILRHVGFFSWPLVAGAWPDGPTTLYRGSTTSRMSWTADRVVAGLLGRRHARFDAAAIYQATVPQSAILAYLERAGEGWTVVIDPTGLGDIELLEAIPASNQTSEG
jgi:hypothetical protein